MRLVNAGTRCSHKYCYLHPLHFYHKRGSCNVVNGSLEYILRYCLQMMGRCRHGNDKNENPSSVAQKDENPKKGVCKYRIIEFM